MTKAQREASDIGAMMGRMFRSLVARAETGDTEALEVLVELQRQSGNHVRAAAQELIAFGYTYADLAQVLGVSRQAATKRFATTIGEQL